MCEQLFNYILINARRLLSLFVRLLSFHLSEEYIDVFQVTWALRFFGDEDSNM